MAPACPAATSELAAAGDGGMHIDLDLVPTRAIGMTPAEVLSSESQERMCAGRRPRERRRVHGGLQEVGRPGHRDR